MALLFKVPDTMFDEARMTSDFESDSASKRRRQDRIAGTTDVGVEKIICGGPGKTQCAEILLKPKVVLERDVVGDGK